jgi:general secretion pathway protein G
MNIQAPSRTAFRNARRAFTLLEIMVVIAIIGLLVGVAVNGVQNALEKSRERTARLFITATLKTPLGTYRIDNGSYPTTADGLSALLNRPANAINWGGPYLEGISAIPNDPGGNPYRYEFPSTRSTSASATVDAVTTTTPTTGVARYDIWSHGADGIDGTADDIGNW